MKSNSSLFQTPMSCSGITELKKSSFRGPSSARQSGIPFPLWGKVGWGCILEALLKKQCMLRLRRLVLSGSRTTASAVSGMTGSSKPSFRGLSTARQPGIQIKQVLLTEQHFILTRFSNAVRKHTESMAIMYCRMPNPDFFPQVTS